MIEGPNGKKYRRNRAHLKPLCHDRSSFQDPPKAKENIPMRRDNVDSFQDPRPRPRKQVMFQDRTAVVPFFSFPVEDDKTSQPKSHSSHCVHSPQSPSSSPPAQFSSREHLVSPHSRGPHRTQAAQNHPTPRRQQTTDTRTCSTCPSNITLSPLQDSTFR